LATRAARRSRPLPMCTSTLRIIIALGLLGAAACTGKRAEFDGDAPEESAPRASSATDTGPPELPRVLLDTRMQPPTGRGRQLAVGHGGDLQRALDDARPGDVILLEPGAEFVGSFTLPKKEGAGWITIRTAIPDTDLPAEGTRMTPDVAKKLARLVTPGDDPALATAPGAHHFRIVAIEITAAPNAARNSALVQFGGGGRDQRDRGDVPHHLVIDRSYVHGRAALSTRRCVALNGAYTAVVDSYLSDCHGRGFDSQAICGWNGPGPFKIVNNYLEGAGENVMFGGGDPGIRNLIPSDIEIRHNYFFKPLAWRGKWTVKNLFELKNAQRVLVEGNVFENNWVDAQSGFALVFKSENQDGGAPWSVTRDVTLRNNKITNVARGLTVLGSAGNATESASRILIQNNVFDRLGSADVGGDGLLWGMDGDPSEITFERNTGFAVKTALMFDELQKTYVKVRNNILTRGSYGIFGSNQGEGRRAIDFYLRVSEVTHNAIVGAPADLYPEHNFFPARLADVGFDDLSRGDYRLTSHSPYKHAGTSGRDIGADIDSLDAATAGVVRRQR
jgi:hypothetical protein